MRDDVERGMGCCARLEIVWVSGEDVDVRERPPRPREREESDSHLSGGMGGMGAKPRGMDGVVAYWREDRVTPPVMWSVWWLTGGKAEPFPP